RGSSSSSRMRSPAADHVRAPYEPIVQRRLLLLAMPTVNLGLRPHTDGIHPVESAFPHGTGSTAKGASIIRISARNQLKGKIVGVVRGQTTSNVESEFGGGVCVLASITKNSAEELQLEVGTTATAISKASVVTVGVD